MSYQQRRVEYEVREYNTGGGSQWSDSYQKPSNGGYGSGFNNMSSGGGGYGSSGGGYGVYKNEVQGMSSGGGYGSSGGGYGVQGMNSGSGGGYGGSGGGYGVQGMNSGISGYGGGYGLYKNEVQGMGANTNYHQEGMGIGDPFCALVPSSFPPGTDPKLIDCFNRIDKDRSGQICDQELQSALSTFDQKFSLRTVHLLMYMFTASNSKVVGPKEFVPLVRSLHTWKATFQKYDFDRNGRLDERELRDSLMSMGFVVSPFVLKLLMSKYDKSGYKCAIEYDYFIECCAVIKGLSEKFRAKVDSNGCGTATFTYDDFLLGVLPFIVA